MLHEHIPSAFEIGALCLAMMLDPLPSPLPTIKEGKRLQTTIYFSCLKVPLDANSNKEHMKYILKKAEVRVVVCSLRLLNELVKILPECPVVRVVILMDVAVDCLEVCG